MKPIGVFEKAAEAHERLNRVRKLIADSVRTFGSKDLPLLVDAERELAKRFDEATALLDEVAQ